MGKIRSQRNFGHVAYLLARLVVREPNLAQRAMRMYGRREVVVLQVFDLPKLPVARNALHVNVRLSEVLTTGISCTVKEHTPVRLTLSSSTSFSKPSRQMKQIG